MLLLAACLNGGVDGVGGGAAAETASADQPGDDLPSRLLAGGGRLADRLLGPPQSDPALLFGAPGRGEGQDRRGRANRTLRGMIEAPELFADTVEVSWGGDATLAGLWIAHAGIDRAHRVRLVNPRTRATIDGALLPRHGAVATGGGVLISSEAAEALGMLPGIPATLEMVAIQPRDVALASQPYSGPAGLTVRDAPVLPPAGAATATAEVPPPSAEMASGTAHGGPATMPGSADPAGIDAEPEQIAAARPEPLPPAPAPAAEPPAEVAPPAETAELTPEPAPDAGPASDPPIAATAETGTAAPAPLSGPISDGKPFVQSGTMRDPELAADLVRTLAAYGVDARNESETIRGEASSRVVAGPFDTHEARARTLDLFRAIGVYGARPSAG